MAELARLLAKPVHGVVFRSIDAEMDSDNKKVFNDACVLFKLGQRLKTEDDPKAPAFPVDERTSQLANELIDSARHFSPPLPPIHFDYIDSGEVNAVSFRDKGRCFIGVNARRYLSELNDA